MLLFQKIVKAVGVKIPLAGLTLFILLAFVACEPEPKVLRMATTTSTVDSGLMDVILPSFEEEYGAKVELIAVGTGQALALGEAGDADIVLVHARSKEDAFVDGGFGVGRQDVMYNDFVILGAANDPADVAGMESAAEALATIAAAEAPFVSRGDESGTHTREMQLWETAGVVPQGDWYQSVGQGMGASLTIADEEQAYILSDRGTYIKRQGDDFSLTVAVEGDGLLQNEYGVIAVNPELHPNVAYDLAQDFISWITSAEIQDAIAAYRVNDQQLFYPDATP